MGLLYLFTICLLGMLSASVSAELSRSSDTSSTNPLSALLSRKASSGSFLGGDLLPPDQAFPPPYLEVRDADTLVVRWQVAKGYYLYRDKFRFRIEGSQGVELGLPDIPRGVFIEEQEDSGPIEVYFHEVRVTLPIIHHTSDGRFQEETASLLQGIPATGAAEETTGPQLIVEYQGCAEAGLCYPPFTKTLPVGFPISEHGITANSATGIVPATKKAKTETAPEQRLAYAILGDGLWVILPIFFGFGLLLGFTPCVFPMVPILTGIIVGQGKDITTYRAFSLSVVYVLAMAITYTVAGVIAGLSGYNLQAAFQNPWIITAFSAIFVLLAISMFGFFEIRMPAVWQTRLTMYSNLQKGGTFVGVGAMGFLSALIVGPCIAPPLAGALIAIGTTGDPLRGGLVLFSLSLGMGTPLIVMGASAGRWLPKAGPWMNATKNIFGVLLLAVAIYFLERILPGQVTLLLWAVLSILIGVYLSVGKASGSRNKGWRRFRKGMGIVTMVYGIILVASAGIGGDNPLAPLEKFVAGEPKGHATFFQRVKTPQELQTKLETLGAEDGGGKRIAMLDYYADWCIECKKMEARTFSDPGVRQELANILLLQADVTANDAQDRAMLQMFGLYGPPTILFFGHDKKEYSAYRVQGFMGAKAFREYVQSVRNAIP
uniref:Thiol:disulfide interchange protein DsbD n=1 Tax=Candidatus Kentrum sp. TUN TaxID=2126343 RepID=A0A450ZR95_9GAMM|nr:MAG: thiol:disulfide interchange protein DsbD [Candidatus Kentron sp. TUN]